MRIAIATILFLGFQLVFSQIKQVKKYHDNDTTKLKEIYHFNPKDSSLVGTYESFFENGSLKILGRYQGNLPDGTWKYYYENGRTKAEGIYLNGKTSGTWKYYYENGNPKHTGKLENGVKNGHWTYYYEYGNKKSNGLYKNGKKFELWDYFYEDGSLRAQTFYQNENGEHLEYYPSGNIKMEGKNVDEKSEGKWIFYYENGKLKAEGFFSTGIKNGVWKQYHQNGKIASIGSFNNGKKEGEWKYFYPNGQLNKSGKLINGKEIDSWNMYYPSGETLGNILYKNDNGKYSEYYPSGNIKATGTLKNGKKTGEWDYFAEDGSIEGKAILFDGTGTYTGYYHNGNKKIEGKIKNGKRVGKWILYKENGEIAGTHTNIYENHKPIFVARKSTDLDSLIKNDKPDYLFEKKKKSRFFIKKPNEYRGIILSTDPLLLVIANKINLSAEYHIYERQGYELQILNLKSPLFISELNIPTQTKYKSGLEIGFSQKFYARNTKSGMLYFGHRIMTRQLNYQFKKDDLKIYSLKESGVQYGFLLGNRWVKNRKGNSLTVDINFGLSLRKNWFKTIHNKETIQSFFSEIDQKSYSFPISLGVNIGYMLPSLNRRTR